MFVLIWMNFLRHDKHFDNVFYSYSVALYPTHAAPHAGGQHQSYVPFRIASVGRYVPLYHNTMAASRDVDVDTRVGRLSPIVAAAPRSIDVDMCDVPPLSSRDVDAETHIKRLYAATHAPVAPPTTPVVDLLCHEHVVLSSTSSDSDDPPTASQRENRPPLCDVNSRNMLC